MSLLHQFFVREASPAYSIPSNYNLGGKVKGEEGLVHASYHATELHGHGHWLCQCTIKSFLSGYLLSYPVHDVICTPYLYHLLFAST